jgi:hypothetical protein
MKILLIILIIIIFIDIFLFVGYDNIILLERSISYESQGIDEDSTKVQP